MTAARTTQGAPLRLECRAVSGLSRLVVHRFDAFADNHIHFSFPPTVTVRGEAEVLKAVKALCALPAAPRNPMWCPNDLGISYHLTFYDRAHQLKAVVADATGCQLVTGLVPTRWAAQSPKFWPTLGSAMGLKAPSWESFTGSGS